MSKQIDPSVGETGGAKGEPDLNHEEFDLAAWVKGLAPAVAYYPLGGIILKLQARTQTWIEALVEGLGEDTTALDANLELIAGHVVEPRGITAAVLAEIRETHAPEVDELLGLVRDLDSKPRNQIAPRFLHAASD